MCPKFVAKHQTANLPKLNPTFSIKHRGLCLPVPNLLADHQATGNCSLGLHHPDWPIGDFRLQIFRGYGWRVLMFVFAYPRSSASLRQREVEILNFLKIWVKSKI